MLIEKLKYMLAPVDPTGASTHQENDFGLLLEPKLRKVFYDTIKKYQNNSLRFIMLRLLRRLKKQIMELVLSDHGHNLVLRCLLLVILH